MLYGVFNGDKKITKEAEQIKILQEGLNKKYKEILIYPNMEMNEEIKDKIKLILCNWFQLEEKDISFGERQKNSINVTFVLNNSDNSNNKESINFSSIQLKEFLSE